jgi:hypothetical protein
MESGTRAALFSKFASREKGLFPGSHLLLHTYRAADGGAQALDSLVAVSIEGHLAIGHLNDPAIAAIPNLQS